MKEIEEKIIEDSYKIDDSHSKARGFVFCYDENDNLLWHRENMIVKSGREKIVKGGFNTKTITKIILGDNTDIVTENDTINDIATDNSNVTNITNFTCSLSEDNDLQFTFEIPIGYGFKENITDEDKKIYPYDKNVLNKKFGNYIARFGFFDTKGNFKTTKIADKVTYDNTDYYFNKYNNRYVNSLYKDQYLLDGSIISLPDGLEVNNYIYHCDFYDSTSKDSASFLVCTLNNGTNGEYGFYVGEGESKIKIDNSIIYEKLKNKLDDTIPISTLGLIYTENGTEKLFSRVVFPTIYKKPLMAFKITYYIYF